MKETKYKNLLSPITIGNLLLRNRFETTLSNPHFVQGPETWPTDALISHYARKAQNGAAVVGVKATNPSKNTLQKDSHTQTLDMYPAKNQHYFVQISDQIHYYGAKAQMAIMPPHELTLGYDATGGMLSGFVEGDGSTPSLGKEAPRELLYDIAEAYGREAKLAKELGFDMCQLDMGYRFMFPARFLSPLTNQRTDEFGGSLENRCRFPLLICEAIRSYCGKDFPIEILVSGEEVSRHPGGTTIEDTIEFCRLGQGKCDILQPRACDIDLAGVSSMIVDHMPTLEMTRAISKGIKENNIDMLVTIVGGAHNPEILDKLIEEGVCDIVGGARNWWCDPEYGRKVIEGRPDDIVPCLRCNKCHVTKPGYWLTCCSVNPIIGLEHKIDRMVTPPERKKKIAVVGGGISGMEAALVSASRGHDVTVYEKSDRLGGLLNCNDGIELKWTVLEFRDYMVNQINKSGVKVLLNTEATVETIKEEDFDEVLVCVGSLPKIPKIEGLDKIKYYTCLDAVAAEKEMGHKVVIIGGNEVGAEFGIHLAEAGHDVTVIGHRARIADDAAAVHYRSLMQEKWESLENFHGVVSAKATAVDETSVTYEDAEGVQHTVPADSIVLAAGMSPNREEALKFWEVGPYVHVIGDCDTPGDIQNCMRSAFGIASNI